MSAGAALEAAHVAAQVLSVVFPSAPPVLVAAHLAAFASWAGLYAIEVAATLAVLERFSGDAHAAAPDARAASLAQMMLPVRLRVYGALRRAAGAARSRPRRPPRAAQPPAAAARAQSLASRRRSLAALRWPRRRLPKATAAQRRPRRPRPPRPAGAFCFCILLMR
jgi:hypothetical protein